MGERGKEHTGEERHGGTGVKLKRKQKSRRKKIFEKGGGGENISADMEMKLREVIKRMEKI